MNFQELNILQKYFYNKVNYIEFEKAMLTVYNDTNYIDNLWEDFKKNPIKFLTSRNEEDVFNYFVEQIKKTNYNG